MPILNRVIQRWPVTIADQLQYLNPHTDSILRAVIEFDGFIDAGTMQNTVERSLQAEPILACRLSEGWWRSYWDLQEPHMHEDCFSLVHAGSDTDGTAGDFMAQSFDPHEKPQVRVRIIRSVRGDTLAVKMHHAVGDAAAFKEYLYLLASIYRELTRNPDYQPEPNRLNKRDFAQVIGKLPLRDCLRNLLNPLRTSPAAGYGIFPWGVAQNPDDAHIITRSYPAEIFQPLKERAHAVKGTLNDIFLAAISRAYRRITLVRASSPLCILYPVDLRRYLPEHRAAVPCNLATCRACMFESGFENESVTQTLKKVVGQTCRTQKGSMDIEAGLIKYYLQGLWPASLQRSSAQKNPPQPFVMFSNFGELDRQRLHFPDAGVRVATVTSLLTIPPTFWITLCTFEATLTVSIGLRGGASHSRVAGDFLRCLDDEIITLVPDRPWRGRVQERHYRKNCRHS